MVILIPDNGGFIGLMCGGQSGKLTLGAPAASEIDFLMLLSIDHSFKAQ